MLNIILNKSTIKKVATSFLFVWFFGKFFPERFLHQNDKIVLNTNAHDKIVHNISRQRAADYNLRTFDTIDDIVNIAKKINKSPVMVTFVNDAYLPLVYNWLCNTVGMNVHNKVMGAELEWSIHGIQLNRRSTV